MSMPAYKSPNQPGFFDAQDRLNDLLAMGDPLQRLDEVVDWKIFRPVLDKLPREEAKGPGGRPAFDPLMLFKVLILGHLYNLSDFQLEFQITDRLSFKRFLGLSDADGAPDEKTIWNFRDKFTRSDLQRVAFDHFNEALDKMGLIARRGQMVDASFVEVPKQRNSRKENAAIKGGETPEGWEDNPNKLRQKDLQARWTKKNNKSFYGYKNHVKVDSRSKLITDFVVTNAAVHDSQALRDLVKQGDPETYVDSAYCGAECQAVFDDCQVQGKVIERPWKNKPLGKRQIRSNKVKSRTRVRVEHVFGAMTMTMKATINRCIGKVRNAAAITMTNLTYNLIRYEQIQRLSLKTWRSGGSVKPAAG